MSYFHGIEVPFLQNLSALFGQYPFTFGVLPWPLPYNINREYWIGKSWVEIRGKTRALIGGGEGGEYSYICVLPD